MRDRSSPRHLCPLLPALDIPLRVSSPLLNFSSYPLRLYDLLDAVGWRMVGDLGPAFVLPWPLAFSSGSAIFWTPGVPAHLWPWLGFLWGRHHLDVEPRSMCGLFPVVPRGGPHLLVLDLRHRYFYPSISLFFRLEFITHVVTAHLILPHIA